MKIESIPIGKLVLDPSNARQHSAKNLEAIKGSLTKFKQQKPIVVDKNNVVIAGNGTLEAARALGWEKIDIVRTGLEGSNATAFAIADNRTGELAEWNDDALKQTLEALKAEGFALDAIGFDDEDLVQWITQTEVVAGCDEDEVPEAVEPKTKPGDLYQLGEHRLLCGDSTNIQQVERLMGEVKADMVFTDPPYGVSYAGKNAMLNAGDRGNRIQVEIKNDHMTEAQTKELWRASLACALVATTNKASYYLTAPQGVLSLIVGQAIQEAGWQLKHILIWVKNNFVLGRCDYHYKHEPIFYGWKQEGTHEFIGDSSQTSVWEFNKPQKNDLHPTMKPVELVEKAITNSCKPKGAVLDLFLGSGSTLIACEKTKRKCYGMEIDAHYCDVIVARWEKYTGKKASLVTGEA